MTAFNQLIDQYLSYCTYQKELDHKTIKAYRIDLTQFRVALELGGVQIDKEGIKQYLALLHTQYKQRSVKRKIASLKAFLAYLEYEEIMEENPIHKVNTRFKEDILLPRSIPRHIVEEFLKKLYEKKEKMREGSEFQKKILVRDIAVIEVLFATGMRVSELCSLRPEEMDLVNRTFRIMGKGSKERYVQIENREVMKALKEYCRLFDTQIRQSGFFFVNRQGMRLSDQSVRLFIQKYTLEFHITMHLTPHMFRHAFATLLLEEEVDIRYIQKLLGHSSIVTTQIYTCVTSEKQKEILSLKHPRNKMIME